MRFVARWAPEHHPGIEIIVECIEAVRCPGGDNEIIAGLLINEKRPSGRIFQAKHVVVCCL